MTRIDFYILQQAEILARHEFACRLIQKTSQLGHSIYIHCYDEKNAQDFDKLLWGFQKNSFIPHKIIGSSGADCSIEIGYNTDTEAPSDHHDLLINLGFEIPIFFSRFNRLIEIVIQENQVLTATRNNYRLYANKNYPLHSHKIE